MNIKLFCSLIVWICLFDHSISVAVEQTIPVDRFINKMVHKHNFDIVKLKKLFQYVDIKKSIINAINKPAEGLPWYKYRKIFITESRINSGLKFWQKHAETLAYVESNYSVAAEIIVAVIGIETQYGGNVGNYRVIDALSTLSFAYPKRSKFFIRELENFLILCREEKINPLNPIGSYAGAMGIPQFMPSSYRAYAVDFENDNKKDIWSNPNDAIASVANYFAKHHWKKNGDIAFLVQAQGDSYKQALTKGLTPDFSWIRLRELSVSSSEKSIKDTEKVKLLVYQQEQGHDLWIGLHNFRVITRYNNSSMYAMAVYQLSEAINKKKQKTVVKNKTQKANN